VLEEGNMHKQVFTPNITAERKKDTGMAVVLAFLKTIPGKMITRIFLTIIFIVIITPIGFFKRLMGYDAMRLKEWKSNSRSVFLVSDRQFSLKDFKKTF
jgi:hypothetical protein